MAYGRPNEFCAGFPYRPFGRYENTRQKIDVRIFMLLRSRDRRRRDDAQESGKKDLKTTFSQGLSGRTSKGRRPASGRLKRYHGLGVVQMVNRTATRPPLASLVEGRVPGMFVTRPRITGRDRFIEPCDRGHAASPGHLTS